MEKAIAGMAALSVGSCACAPRTARFSRPAALSSRTSAKTLSSSASVVFSSARLALTPLPSVSPAPKASLVQVVAEKKYKIKTHKASAKRFRVTGSGKIVRRKAWRAHLLRKKSTSRKNRLAGMTEVFRGDIDKIVGAMPYLKVRRISRQTPRERPAKITESTESTGEQES